MLVLPKKKTTPFISDQNPGRNWKKGYDILPTHIWGFCHKAMKFSDPGTWELSTVFLGECQIRGFCCHFARCFRRVVDSISEWDRTYGRPMPGSTPRILGSGALEAQLKPQPFFSCTYLWLTIPVTVRPWKLLEKENSYCKPTSFWGERNLSFRENMSLYGFKEITFSGVGKKIETVPPPIAMWCLQGEGSKNPEQSCVFV